MKLQGFSVNCLITCWKKKISHLFPDRILDLQQHEGVYSKMYHLGKWGSHPHPCHPVLFCFVSERLEHHAHEGFWNDWLTFLLFSLILTFCWDCVHHNVPSSWHQNWCKVSVWRLGLWTPECSRETTWSSWDLEVTLANENVLGFGWDGPSASQEGFKRSWTDECAHVWDWKRTPLGNQAPPKSQAHTFWV